MTNCVKLTTEVYCTLAVEGLHFWPGCPFEEVAYLRDPHRHLFHIKAYKKVNHDDRDVEFIMLKHKIQKYLLSAYHIGVKTRSMDGVINLLDFGAMSCEMIANDLIAKFDLSRCEVNEDGENGAIVTVDPIIS